MRRGTGNAAPSSGLVGNLLRVSAAALSAGAALVSILSYTGTRADADSGGTPDRAHRLALTPLADTAASLGDSLQLAALVTDDRGAALLGVAPAWSSADPAVAQVDQAGTVVARSPGTTVVIVRVGRLETRARILVAPRPAALRPTDTLLRIPEGERSSAVAMVSDGRGHPIADAPVRWLAADAAVATVDSLGAVQGVSPGRTLLTAAVGELRAELPVEVVPVPASITVLEGEDQRAPAGHPLAKPVTAQIVSRTGRPIAGVAAAFVPRGRDTASAAVVDTSDERGVVHAVWTLDAVPGRQQLAITVEGVAVTPVVSAEADPVPANTRVTLANEPERGTAGDSLPSPIVIRVTDSTGLALADLPVSWSSPDGGRAAALGTRTDSAGEARALWRLGPRAGRQRLLVQVGNPRSLPPLVVTATAAAGTAESLAVRGGAGQRATAGSRLARPVVVRALDRLGNPVPGVRLKAVPGAGRLADSTVTTDSLGQAKLEWTLGGKAGTQRLAVSLGGRDQLEVTARATAGPPAKLAFAGAPPSTPAAKPLKDSLTLELSDAHGNPLAKRRITLSATGGTVAPARVVTDSAGRARVRWTPGSRPGPATLIAKVEKSELRARQTVQVVARRTTGATPRRAP